jgi:glucokinase
MLLAGDIGGTKTLLGLFDPVPARPRPLAVRVFPTLDFDDLTTMIAAFLDEDPTRAASIESACFGVAGPVIGDIAELTNVPWLVDARRVATKFKLRHVSLLNDLHAMAYSVPVLRAAEVHALQQGRAVGGGNRALIAAGTGLGEALLHYVDGRFIPSPSEGGHADFAARTERDILLLRDLIERYGRADVERVVSGPGLTNVHRVTHRGPCEASIDLEDPDAPMAISAAALDRRCDGCVEALELFVEAYGAEAGNLALRTVATGGVFIGGGIAPKILPALTDGRFMRAFREKAPLEAMLEAMPVKVILNTEAGLLGAAVYAAAG